MGGLLSDGGRSEGAFVLYNYARLATLVKNYYTGVEKGGELHVYMYTTSHYTHVHVYYTLHTHTQL